jgi:hypothetical protein
MESTKALEPALVDAIGDPSLEVLSEGAEILLDSFLIDGVGKEIPVVSTLIQLGRDGVAVNNYLLAKKLARFLGRLADVPLGERQRFVADNAESEKKQRLGETLLQLIERAENSQKAELLGEEHFVPSPRPAAYRRALELTRQEPEAALPRAAAARARGSPPPAAVLLRRPAASPRTGG